MEFGFVVVALVVQALTVFLAAAADEVIAPRSGKPEFGPTDQKRRVRVASFTSHTWGKFLYPVSTKVGCQWCNWYLTQRFGALPPDRKIRRRISQISLCFCFFL